MEEEKLNKNESENNPNEEKGNKMAEDLLNEIEQESRAEAGEVEQDEHKESEEGLLGKIGFGKKDKHHKKEIKELNDKIAELNDKYLRLFAEFDNAKKRNARERQDLQKTAGLDVIVSLLGTLDDFGRATKQIEGATDVEAVKEGVNLVFNKLKSTLEARGLKEMKSVGEEFNPDLHDAITEIPAPTEELKGKVVDEIEKGYTLNDKIIRHAKVIVGR